MGNQHGLSLSDRLDRMEQEINDLKEHKEKTETSLKKMDISLEEMETSSKKTEISLIKQHENFLNLRTWELQQAGRPEGHNPPFGAGFGRNRFIHGGNIKLDLEGIKSLLGTRSLAGATAGFKVLYGRLPVEIEPHFHDVPEEVVKAFDHRGDLTRLDVLKSQPKHKESVDLCDKIITAWLNSVKIPGLGSQLHVIRQMYHELMEIIPV